MVMVEGLLMSLIICSWFIFLRLTQSKDLLKEQNKILEEQNKILEENGQNINRLR